MELTIISSLVNEAWTGTIPTAPAGTDDDTNERIFRIFNRVTDADCDWLNDVGYNLPSLSVGDVILYNGKGYRVARIGFDVLDAGAISEAKSKAKVNA